MKRENIKAWLGLLPEKIFIDWHNEHAVDPYGDFAYSIIRTNDDEIKQALMDNFDMGQLFSLVKNSNHYSSDDKYAIILCNQIWSFDSIIEFLNDKNLGDGIVDIFEEYPYEYISELREMLERQ